MEEEKNRLRFQVLPANGGIIVKIQVVAPYIPRPTILERLYDSLSKITEIVKLGKTDFPAEDRTLLALFSVLSLGRIAFVTPRKGIFADPSGRKIDWDVANGHFFSVFVAID